MLERRPNHRNLTQRVVRAVALATILATVVAAPVFAVVYAATLTISETGGASYTNLALFKSVNNKWAAANGFMLPDARDTGVETASGSPRPHTVADDRVLAVTDVPAHSTTNLYYTTNNTAADFDIITGVGGNVTIADAAALESGNNTVFEFDGWVDTTAPASIIDKASAFLTSVPGAGQLEAQIEPVRDFTGVGVFAVPGVADVWGANWFAQTFTPLETHYVTEVQLNGYETGAAPGLLTVSIRNTIAGVPTGTDLVSGSVVASSWGVLPADNIVTLTSSTKLEAGTMYAIVLRLPNGVGAANDIVWQYETSDIIANGTYSASAASGILGSWVNNAARDFRFTERGPSAMVISSVASGEYTVQVAAEAGTSDNLTLALDGWVVDSTPLNGASIPDNANDWHLYPIYWTYYSHSVGGVEIVHYQPNDIIRGVAYTTGTAAFANGSANVTAGGAADWDDSMDGAVIKLNADNSWFVIDSVTSNTTLTLTANYAGVGGAGAYTIAPRLPDLVTATTEEGAISWGTNPSGITLSLGSFTTTAATGSAGADATPDTLPDMETSDWFTESSNSTLHSNPLYPVVSALSVTGGLTTFTEQQVWRFFAIMAILLLMAGAGMAVPGHILVIGIAQMLGMTGAVALTIFPLWAVVVAAGFLLATLVMERSISW